MQVFYSQTITDDTAYFDESESAHALQVLRMKNGDTMHFTDGKGNLYTGIVNTGGKKNMAAMAITLIENQPQPRIKIHIGISPLKNNDRLEWFTEKAVELGVWSITPVITRNTVKKNINEKRLNGIILSAMKQSMRYHLPVLGETVKLEKIAFENATENYFGYCGNIEKKSVDDIRGLQKDIFFLVGPEGDFTPEEADFLIKKNVTPVSLGSTRLRTETAGLYAMAMLKLKTS